MEKAVMDVLEEEAKRSYLPVDLCAGEELVTLLDGVRDLWRNEEANAEWLQELESDQQAYLAKLK